MKQEKQERLPVFCERLAELQAKQGKETISEFALFLGLSRQTVSFYLSGDRLPDAQVLSMICQKCKVSCDWLLGLSEESPLDPSAKIAADYIGASADAVDNLHAEKERMRGKNLSEAPIAGILSIDRNKLLAIDDLIAESITFLLFLSCCLLLFYVAIKALYFNASAVLPFVFCCFLLFLFGVGFLVLVWVSVWVFQVKRKGFSPSLSCVCRRILQRRFNGLYHIFRDEVRLPGHGVNPAVHAALLALIQAGNIRSSASDLRLHPDSLFRVPVLTGRMLIACCAIRAVSARPAFPACFLLNLADDLMR